MRNVIFFDNNEVRTQLLPLTYTRPMCRLRIGIDTIEQKWQSMLGPEARYSYLTATYLAKKYPLHATATNLMVAGNIVPTPQLAKQVLALQPGQALVTTQDELVAFYGTAHDFDDHRYSKTIKATDVIALHMLYDIFELNAQVLEHDFERLTAGRQSQPVSPTCTVVGDPGRIFIEPGASVEGAFLNTKEGPIYIGERVEVMEGACIRAPFAACHDAKVRMGAKVYGATTLGPFCKVGGELENVVMIGMSNKAHDGYLGDAVIGEWCNLGGGTTASNLKNDYGEIRLWNYATRHFDHTGRQFCGLIMGDHCKTGVNCMINTATVLGVGVNVHGAGFPRNFVRSFQEGSYNAGFKTVKLDAFFATARVVMARRGVELTEVDRKMYQDIFEISKKYE